MPRFVIGLLSGTLLAIATPIVVIAAGFVDMSAAEGPGFLEQVLGHWAFERWVETSAPDVVSAAPPTTEAWLAGYEHYRDTCVHCHGAPGVKPAEWARHMVPEPPDLSHANDGLSEPEIFLVVDQGVRMTGMPAFGEDHSEEELWQIVRFVRDIDHIEDWQREQLRAAIGGHRHGEASHGGHHGDGRDEETPASGEPAAPPPEAPDHDGHEGHEHGTEADPGT